MRNIHEKTHLPRIDVVASPFNKLGNRVGLTRSIWKLSLWETQGICIRMIQILRPSGI